MSDDPAVLVTNEVLSYFLRHPQAADSLEGIARWRLLSAFVERNVEETRRAVNWLVEQGYLSATRHTGGTDIYSLNPEHADQARDLLSVPPPSGSRSS